MFEYPQYVLLVLQEFASLNDDVAYVTSVVSVYCKYYSVNLINLTHSFSVSLTSRESLREELDQTLHLSGMSITDSALRS